MPDFYVDEDIVKICDMHIANVAVEEDYTAIWEEVLKWTDYTDLRELKLLDEVNK